VFPIAAPEAESRRSRHPSPFSFSSQDAKPFWDSEGIQTRVNAPFSTSVAIPGVPAGGPLHRRRRCATRTNVGTLKGTRLRLFLRRRRPSRSGRRDTTARGAREQKWSARDPISALNRSKRSLIAGSSRRVFAPIHHASKGAASSIGWRSRLAPLRRSYPKNAPRFFARLAISGAASNTSEEPGNGGVLA
jgi:hypothetical protein